MDAENRERIAEQWLDGALKQYGEAEPRTGLEGRILANLRVTAAASPERRRWLLVLAGAAAIFTVGAAIYLGNNAPKKDIAAVQAPASLQAQTPAVMFVPPTVMTPTQAVVPRNRTQRRERLPLVRTERRLDHFPTPRPLSSQEQLLARYVHERPEEAKRKAQAQADLFQQDLAEFEKRPEVPQAGQIQDRD